MARALQEHCGDVQFVGPMALKGRSTIGRVLSEFFRITTGKAFNYSHSKWLSINYGKRFAKRLLRGNYDLIFAPAAAAEIAYLETDIPIVYASDTTFALAHGYYSQYSNLLQWSYRSSMETERRAIDTASVVLYPSDWAAASAIQDFAADPGKVFVTPYGANLDYVPDAEVVRQRRTQESNDRITLLFIGVSWERKGGDIAYETLLALEQLGMSARLIVCGCVPPKGVTHKNMKVIPFLDKHDSAQRLNLTELFLESTFLLVPTRADCYGIVFCEASAHGLPSVSTATGGVPAAVVEGKNGVLLSASATGTDYAHVIAEIYEDSWRYRQLVESSRNLFETTHNWDHWGKNVANILESSVLAK